ncbi:MAG: alanine--tRNA ligase [Candidatus Micrarchaeota archaeon]|nr:alanine--tRNA ligase [Candidatus Micrarchaeota archaeon]
MVGSEGVVMLSKDKLREGFSKEPGKYYSVRTFRKEGFERRQCDVCGKYFWTSDSKRELCGDPSHEPYSLMREKPKDITYFEFWKKFSKFFSDSNHEVIEKYPVVSRWRQDLYFTIASIQDFQRIEKGKMSFEYNANPLLVPQICMRFNDIPNVGLTGRHLTSFMMAGQHAFNYPKEGYWRDRTIELNYKVLTNLLGIKKKNLTYVEDVWAMGDFSEYGPCLESFANGLEIVNSVFTQFEYVNGRIGELKGKVVDVGWGFERLLWFYTGHDTLYDAVFRKELEYIHKSTAIRPNRKIYAKVAPYLGSLDATESGNTADLEMRALERAKVPVDDYYSIIKPMQASYAIADHTRSLLFAISDGALPSNVGGGYNLRVILRRVLDFMEQYRMELDLIKLMELHAKDLKPLYNDIDESISEINEIISIERKRYSNTKEQALRIVTQILSNNEQLTAERARMLYESNGITPDFISSVAESKGIKMDIPEESYNSIIKSDFASKRKEHKHDYGIDMGALQKTEKLYYRGIVLESKSKVLASHGAYVVLDKTPFYPEGGGQEADTGTINGVKVKDVQNANGIIVHTLEKHADLKNGATASCAVDRERRVRLMAHHTATHLISAASRKILGKHAWQEGAHKGAAKAHIDVSHYERLTPEQIQKIEDTANSYITHGIKVAVQEMGRNEAESRFGFSIYQGHGVPGSRLRIVQVKDLDGNIIDAEACGGLHLSGMESVVGLIKITNSSRIHDGINRIEFVAGPAAQEHMDRLGSTIESIASNAGIDKDKLDTGLSAKLEELKLYRDRYQKAEEELSFYIAKDLANAQGKLVVKQADYSRSMLRKIATLFAESNKERVLILYNGEGHAIAMAGTESRESAIDSIKAYAKSSDMDFRGGGSRRMAEGKMVEL